MEEMENAMVQKSGGARLKKGGKKPLIVIGIILAVIAAAYLGLCAYAGSLEVFYPNTTINEVDVAGCTVAEAAERLRAELPGRQVEFYLPLPDQTGTAYPPQRETPSTTRPPPPRSPTGTWA